MIIIVISNSFLKSANLTSPVQCTMVQSSLFGLQVKSCVDRM